MNVDPLAEVQPDKTPYHFCSNNPINRTDPTGMIDGDWDDDYQTDKNGNVKLIKKTDEKTDTLYNEDKSKSVEVRKGLIGQLTGPREKDGSGTAYTSVGEQSDVNEKDYFKLFKFLSDNANNVEFSLDFFKHRGKDWIELGTYHDSQMAPVANVDRKDIYKTYHSHSDTKDHVPTERYSMGQGSDGWIYPGIRSDFYNTVTRKYPHPNYVYFPISGRMYNVTQADVDFIKIVKTPSDFKIRK